MKNVYVVSEGVDYQGSSPIRAFESKKDADSFVKSCNSYHGTRPAHPDGSSDDAFNAWYKKKKAWAKRHPGGEDAADADYFNVVKVPFGVPAPKQEGASEP